MVFSAGCAEWGDGVLDAFFVADDGVYLAFADEGKFCFCHVLTGFV